MRRAFVPMLGFCCCLVSCMGPRSAVMPRTDALEERDPWLMRVVAIHDGLLYSRDPHLTHLVEVEVLAGTEAGRRITLPYDAFAMGEDPPGRGREVTVAPATWVTGPARPRRALR